jgi:hypothetical protein
MLLQPVQCFELASQVGNELLPHGPIVAVRVIRSRLIAWRGPEWITMTVIVRSEGQALRAGTADHV